MKLDFLKLTHKIVLEAGNGGLGKVSFTKNTRSGLKRPDGGDGGDGGNIIMRKSSLVNDIANIPKLIVGNHGFNGKKGNKMVKKGVDKNVLVPLNYDIFYNNCLIESLLLRGGKGQPGNKSCEKIIDPTNINFGEKAIINFKIKYFSHFSLVGPPNSGKTTLINRLCNTNFETSYVPGNTVNPNIANMNLDRGVKIAEMRDDTILIADFPGFVNISDFTLYQNALYLSKNIIIVSDDKTMNEHISFAKKLFSLNSLFKEKVIAFLMTKIGNEELNSMNGSSLLKNVKILYKIEDVAALIKKHDSNIYSD